MARDLGRLVQYSKTRWRDPASLLITTMVGLMALQLGLSWHLVGNFDALVMESLSLAAIFILIWRRRYLLNLSSDPGSSLLGLGLLGLSLLHGLSLFPFQSDWLRVFPFGVAIGLALLASGVRGLPQYWREGILLGVMTMPIDLVAAGLTKLLDFTVLTAKAATFGMWYLGLDVVRQGRYIQLPSGMVEVAEPCTGMRPMLLMLQLAVILWFLSRFSRKQKLGLLGTAIVLGFGIGVIRVGLLAIVVDNQSLFEYWHGDPGNQIFSNLALLSFGGIFYWLQQRNSPPPRPNHYTPG